VTQTPALEHRLGPAFDLLAAYRPGSLFFEREGLGVTTLPGPGDVSITADRSDPEGLRALSSEVLAALRARHRTDDAAPPLAAGSIAFDPNEPATLTIAAGWVRRTEPGATWARDAMGPQGGLASSPRASGSHVAADAFALPQLREVPSAEDYGRDVAAITERIQAGEVAKVVLARTLDVDAGRILDAASLLRRLRAVEPHSYTFAAPVSGSGSGDALATMVGASPELLCSRTGDIVRSVPLAGSAPRSGDAEQDRASAAALQNSDKERREHAFVVDAIAAALGEHCAELTWDPEPVLLETANVWHLATRFHGRLGDPNIGALALVADLHPTPAVCGTPREAARAIIEELEPFPRGTYAGPIGWMDATGDGAWAIALRCAELTGKRARLFAGAGIVEGSDPAAETEETRRKFLAFLDPLRWG
jgi:isochorismate synthase